MIYCVWLLSLNSKTLLIDNNMQIIVSRTVDEGWKQKLFVSSRAYGGKG